MMRATLAELAERLQQTTGPAERAKVLQAIRDAARQGADVTALVPALVEALSDRPWKSPAAAAGALEAAVQHGRDVRKALPALQSALDKAARARPSEGRDRLQYALAKALMALAVSAADLALGEGLLSHPSGAVREGAGAACAASIGPGLPGLVGALAQAAGDDQTGVRYQAVAALRAAAVHGVDVSAAVPALEAHLGSTYYSREGWALGLDPIGSSDLVQESPAGDAAAALIRHFANRRAVPEAKALLRHRLDEVRNAARYELEQVQAGAAQPEARRWAQAVLAEPI